MSASGTSSYVPGDISRLLTSSWQSCDTVLDLEESSNYRFPKRRKLKEASFSETQPLFLQDKSGTKPLANGSSIDKASRHSSFSYNVATDVGHYPASWHPRRRIAVGIRKAQMLRRTGDKLLENMLSRSEPSRAVEQQPSKETQQRQNGSDSKRTRTEEDDLQRLRRTLFVGNLPLKHHKSALLKHLQIPKKEVDAMWYRSLPLHVAKEGKEKIPAVKQPPIVKDSKNAYIVLKLESLVESALNRNATEFEGYFIRVDKMASEQTFSKFTRKRSVFVGNLALSVTENALHRTFASVGQVTGVRIVRDRQTQVSKGFGFVLFAERGSVPNAIKTLNQEVLRGRAMHVTKALKEEAARAEDNEKRSKRDNSRPRKRFACKRIATTLEKRTGDGRKACIPSVKSTFPVRGRKAVGRDRSSDCDESRPRKRFAWNKTPLNRELRQQRGERKRRQPATKQLNDD